MNFAHTILDWAAQHRDLAFAVVFLLALVEAFPVFGGFVPGSSIIAAIGALLPTTVGSLLPVIAAAALGASLGDFLSYILGHHYQRAILGRWPIRDHPDAVERSEAFVRRHGVASVIFARFLPPVRALVPLLAGILQMPVQRYLAANLVAAFLWSPVHVLSGAVIGNSFEFIESRFSRYTTILAVIAAFTALIFWLSRRAIRPGSRLFPPE